MTDQDKNSQGGIRTVPELLAHALEMETEASDRYGELAQQMEMHRKADVAALFRKLEKAERAHLGELQARCAREDLPHYAPWEFQWPDGESPEAIDLLSVSYELTLKGALELALAHERRAAAFYTTVEAAATDADVRTLAREFAAEEHQHVAWIEKQIAACGPEADMVLDDPDPPLCQE